MEAGRMEEVRKGVGVGVRVLNARTRVSASA